MEKSITYFENPGPENTDAVIGLVKERLEGSDIKYVAVASSTGASALKLNEALKDLDVTIVNCSHHVGFKEPNKAQIDEEAIAHGTTPDYSSLEYNIIYFKDININLYDYLDRSILFQDELFEKQDITEVTYFGSDINKIEE